MQGSAETSNNTIADPNMPLALLELGLLVQLLLPPLLDAILQY